MLVRYIDNTFVIFHMVQRSWRDSTVISMPNILPSNLPWKKTQRREFHSWTWNEEGSRLRPQYT